MNDELQVTPLVTPNPATTFWVPMGPGAIGPQGPVGPSGGNAPLVTSVAALPASPADGAIAFLWTPALAVQLLQYDAASAHWYSQRDVISVLGQGENAPWNTTGNADVDNVSLPQMTRRYVPMKPWTDAGFLPQIFMRGMLQCAGAGSGAVITPQWRGCNNGSSPSSQVSWLAGFDIRTGTTTWVYKEGGWSDITPGFTVYDVFGVLFRISTTSGSISSKAHSVSCELRWRTA